MTQFTFTSPEGKSYTVTGPDGSTQEQAFSMLQTQLGNAPSTQPAQQPPASPPVDPMNKVAMAEAANPNFRDAGTAFANHVANAVTLGQMPRLQAVVAGVLPEGEDRGFGENYARAKLEGDQLLAQQAADSPVASKAGDITGDTIPYLMGPEAGLAKKAIASGTIGAAQGAGNTAANIDFSNDQARQAALTEMLKSGGIGALGGVGGELLGAGAGVIASHVAPHAAGIQKSIVKNLTPDARADLQQYLLADQPNALKDTFFSPSAQTVDNPVLGAFKTSGASRDANNANMAQGGKLIGDTIDNVKTPVDTYDVMNSLNDGSPAVATGRKGPYNAPGQNASNVALDQFIDNLPQPNAGDVSLRNIQDMKTDLGDQTRFSPLDSAQSNANDANQRMWANLKGLIESKVKASDPTGQAAADLERGNYLYRNAKNAEDLINNKINREDGNNLLGFSGKLAAASMLGHGGLASAPAAVAEAAGIEGLNKFGPGIMTSVLDHGARSKVGLFPQLTNALAGANGNQELTDEEIAQQNHAQGKF